MRPEEPESKSDSLSRFNLSSLEHTFKNFRQLKGTEQAYDAFYKLSQGKLGKKFVFCYGTVGCGKTHLIEATVIEWAKQGIGSRYQTMSEIMRWLKKAMKPNSVPPYDMLFERVCNQDKLIIDDVGMGTIESNWELAELEDIINERYHKRFRDDGKVTILASNKKPSDLPDRVVSRFFDPEVGVVVFIGAGDYRRRE